MPTVQTWNSKKQRYNIVATTDTLETSLIAMRYAAGLEDKFRIRMKVYYGTNQALCITRKPLLRGKGRLGCIKYTGYNRRTGYTYLVELLNDQGCSKYEPPSSILAFNKPPTTGIDYPCYDSYTWNFDNLELPIDYDQYSREDWE